MLTIAENLTKPFPLARAAAETTKEEEAAELHNRPVKIDIHNLSVHYGKFRAIAEVTMAVPAHQVTAIIGPSGCGKSTLLRSLNRMNDLTPGAHAEGEILLDGENIYAPGVDVVRSASGSAWSSSAPTRSPRAFTKTWPTARACTESTSGLELDEIVERSLQQAALWDEVKDKLHQSGMALSGGQQQRLCIARALAVEPEVILMDEPASALDPIATLKIEDLMQQLKSEYTIVIVTHNMQQAARVSDFTAFLMIDGERAGRLIEYGPTRRIFTRPEKKETEDYVTGRFG